MSSSKRQDGKPQVDPKRANGEGSVYTLADGTWMVVVTGTDGRRTRRKPKLQTSTGAQRLLRLLLKAVSYTHLTLPTKRIV